MTGSEMSPADYAAVGGNSFGSFGGECGGGFWIFALLILFGMLGGGGGIFGNRDARAATVEDLNNSANFTRLEGQVMNNGNRIENKADAVYSGICDLGYEISQQFAATNAQMANCCCTTQRAIDGVNYNAAMNTAAINANTTAQTQKILDAIAQNKIDALQARINQLEMQNALYGVVRYPTQTVYNSGTNPFCGGQTCNANY